MAARLRTGNGRSLAILAYPWRTQVFLQNELKFKKAGASNFEPDRFLEQLLQCIAKEEPFVPSESLLRSGSLLQTIKFIGCF
jgi:hypothetical protein